MRAVVLKAIPPLYDTPKWLRLNGRGSMCKCGVAAVHVFACPLAGAPSRHTGFVDTPAVIPAAGDGDAMMVRESRSVSTSFGRVAAAER